MTQHENAASYRLRRNILWVFVLAFAFVAGCKDGKDTREAISKDSIPYNAFVHKVEPSFPRPPPKEAFIQSEYFLDGINKGNLIARILGFPNRMLKNPNFSHSEPEISFSLTEIASTPSAFPDG